MRASRIVLLAAGAATVAGTAAVLARRSSAAPPDERWRTVTILRSQDDIGMPRPLAALGDSIEVRITAAPGDRGSELSARLRRGDGQPDLLPRLRIALRESKQLLEAGETAVVDPRPHGDRAHTQQGALLDAVTRAAAGEGVL